MSWAHIKKVQFSSPAQLIFFFFLEARILKELGKIMASLKLQKRTESCIVLCKL